MNWPAHQDLARDQRLRIRTLAKASGAIEGIGRQIHKISGENIMPQQIAKYEIGLADFIDSFRREIETAVERGKNQRLQFRASKIDLELQFTVENTRGVNGELDFKVLGVGFGAGGDNKSSNKAVHTVKLSLEPIETEIHLE